MTTPVAKPSVDAGVGALAGAGMGALAGGGGELTGGGGELTGGGGELTGGGGELTAGGGELAGGGGELTGGGGLTLQGVPSTCVVLAASLQRNISSRHKTKTISRPDAQRHEL